MKKILLILFATFAFVNCYAQDIKIDGDFSDWVDKPAINSDKNSDDAINAPKADVPVETTPQPAQNESQIENTPTENLPTVTQSVTEAPQQVQASPSVDQSDILDGPTNLPETTTSDATVEDNNGPKFKIHQLRWSVSGDSNVLYIMLRLSQYAEADNTIVTTELVTDYGNFVATTTYNTDDGSVFTDVSNSDIKTNEGRCEVVNKNQAYIEYAIPLDELIKDMKWGYMIKMKVQTEDDVEPKNDYIIISTASTGAFVGIGISVLFASLGFYLLKRKKTQ